MVAPSVNHGSACGACGPRTAPTVPITVSAQSAPRAPDQSPRPESTPPRFHHPSFDIPDPAQILDPTPREASSLFRALTDPYQSLDSVAGNHNVTLDALSEWMAKPEVSQKLDNMESAAARHARLAAANHLPEAANALIDVVRAYTHLENHVPLPPYTEAREQRRRQAEGTRKAAWLLFRIARFYAGPPTPPTPRRVEAHPAKDGTLITTPASSTALPLPTSAFPVPPSLPPLDKFADALHAVLAQARPNTVATPNGTAIRAVNAPATQSSGTGIPPVPTAAPSTATDPVLSAPAATPSAATPHEGRSHDQPLNSRTTPRSAPAGPCPPNPHADTG